MQRERSGLVELCTTELFLNHGSLRSDDTKYWGADWYSLDLAGKWNRRHNLGGGRCGGARGSGLPVNAHAAQCRGWPSHQTAAPSERKLSINPPVISSTDLPILFVACSGTFRNSTQNIRLQGKKPWGKDGVDGKGQTIAGACSASARQGSTGLGSGT